jgi:NAD(P) transhydrogenase subunit alpha
MNTRPLIGDAFNTHREGVAVRVAVPKETVGLERRVALVPESCKRLIQAGYDITIETGAGAAAFYPDRAYQDAGAAVSDDRAALLREADLVLRVAPPPHGIGPGEFGDISAMRPGAILVGSLMPQRNLAVVRALARHCITAFSTDAIPRTTRAQSMDTLSSMASIAGYRGVLLAAEALPRYLPMLTTAAGMVPPAKVFVVGAAVAGLQAIATAKRLGATVTATDVRPEVKEQIESVGAKYVGIDVAGASAGGGGGGGGGGYAGALSAEDKERQQVLLAEQCAAADVVITTALIGGVFAPRIITAAMVRGMKPGSVLVDLAADGGGNCELSRPGETVVENSVTILAPINVPAAMPAQASLLFSRNLTAFVQAFTRDKAFQLDPADEIQQGALITHDGQVVHARTRDALDQA